MSPGPKKGQGVRSPVGFPVVVSAPSGTGKTSLCRAVVERNANSTYSVSVTSRSPSASERDGEDYTFISKEAFEAGIKNKEFIEWTEYRGCYYGTPREPLERALRKGSTVLLDLDIIGARDMKAVYPGCVTVYLLAPSLEELERRLRGRARDSEREIRGRLNNAVEEMKNIQEYDYAFVNERFEESVERLRCIIEAEKCRIQRRTTEENR